MRWIDIIDHKPPSRMLVIFYVRDLVDGYTEDRFVLGRYNDIDGDFLLQGYPDGLLEVGNNLVTHWTLPPPSPFVAPCI